MSTLRGGMIRRALTAALSAVLVGVVGISAVPAETAQAAGVVVERYQPFGTASMAARGRDDG